MERTVQTEVKMLWQLATSPSTRVFAQVPRPALENGAMKPSPAIHYIHSVSQYTWLEQCFSNFFF